MSRPTGRRISLAALATTLVIAFTGSAAAGASASTGDITLVANPPRVFIGSDLPATFTNPFCHTDNGVAQQVCYTPADIRTAYDYPSDLDGSGQTIVIIDAFGSPTITADLTTFDARLGIPAPPSFTIDCPQGCPTYNPEVPDEPGWAVETSLDVEWAHAMAPGANLVLVVAASDFGNAIGEALTSAVEQYPDSILSQSFGGSEATVAGYDNLRLKYHALYQTAAKDGDTVFAASGDLGATSGGQTEAATWPASDPLVTAVGGTEGDPYFNAATGQPLPTCALNTLCNVGLAVVKCSTSSDCPTVGYGGEQVWNEPIYDAAGGGAESLLFAAPSYQLGVNGSTRRTTPDVSYNAAVSGGVLVYISAPAPQGCTGGCAPGYYIVGGTSAGTPQWAAITALANQARHRLGKSNLGFLNNTLYSIAEGPGYQSDFHDITVGNNQLAGTPIGYPAGPGYDIASGWGTPQVANLVAALAAT
jgi:subtilase family serine protease